MMNGLLDHCLSQETVTNRLRVKAKAMEAELGELKAVQENKFDLTKKLLEESKA